MDSVGDGQQNFHEISSHKLRCPWSRDYGLAGESGLSHCYIFWQGCVLRLKAGIQHVLLSVAAIF